MVRKTRGEVREQWRVRLRRFAGSQLSVAEFCRREQVSVPSFYLWRKKLTDVSHEAPATTGKFLPVKLTSRSAVSLQAAFPNGTTLTLGLEDPRLLQVAIAAIAQVGTTDGEA